MPPTVTKVQFLIEAALKTHEKTVMTKKVEVIVEKKVEQFSQDVVVEAEVRVVNDIYFLV